MAWWEYIPIVKTVGHGLAQPPGISHSDYIDCACTAADCEGLGAEAAKTQCVECVKLKLAKFASDWSGSSIGADFFEVAAGATVGMVGSALAKSAGGSFLGLAATAWTGVGAVLAIDGLIDSMIILKKLLDMRAAADKAIAVYCRCGAA